MIPATLPPTSAPAADAAHGARATASDDTFQGVLDDAMGATSGETVPTEEPAEDATSETSEETEAPTSETSEETEAATGDERNHAAGPPVAVPTPSPDDAPPAPCLENAGMTDATVVDETSEAGPSGPRAVLPEQASERAHAVLAALRGGERPAPARADDAATTPGVPTEETELTELTELTEVTTDEGAPLEIAETAAEADLPETTDLAEEGLPGDVGAHDEGSDMAHDSGGDAEHPATSTIEPATEPAAEPAAAGEPDMPATGTATASSTEEAATVQTERPPASPPATAPTAPAPTQAAAHTAQSANASAPGAPAPVVDQLVTHVSSLSQGPDGTQQLTIELAPEELGRVTLEVTVEDGVVHVRLQADDPMSRRLLAASLGDLRTALDAADLRAGSLDVGQHGPQADGQTGDRRDERDSTPHTQRQPRLFPPTQSAPRAAAATSALDVLL